MQGIIVMEGNKVIFNKSYSGNNSHGEPKTHEINCRHGGIRNLM